MSSHHNLPVAEVQPTNHTQTFSVMMAVHGNTIASGLDAGLAIKLRDKRFSTLQNRPVEAVNLPFQYDDAVCWRRFDRVRENSCRDVLTMLLTRRVATETEANFNAVGTIVAIE
ncbi:hypothetical protein FKW77_009943 [Venturia effusa]|uniref:Uncharacterized protein n=1 Tax=Venturia effusa TaxID=50376 RepID=A0A517KXH1_9PEZI|nr:hypothetical protein FKW77_009943 [Venturia effusa]